MTPEHLKKLREISEQFQQGTASHENIKQLNDILTMVNVNQVATDISIYGNSAKARKPE